ncbi:MAG: hypothetical protein EOQ44_07405 [Mesorhizobium sp.]|nr:hypothetical protein EJ072_05645 [Mesorhizobium sp. M2A.F.Ca.ET.046.03.2.1]RWB47001.1 MAG: hypothetical protein EOQ44_07405 [Mesorhizobium sp.]
MRGSGRLHHPPRYAALLKPSSPSFRHSSGKTPAMPQWQPLSEGTPQALTALIVRLLVDPRQRRAPPVERERRRQDPVGWLIAAFRVDLLRRPKPLRPIPDQPPRGTNSNPSTPGNGRVGSRECTPRLKSAGSASPGHI